MSNEQLQSFQLMASPYPWFNCSQKAWTFEAPVLLSTLKYGGQNQKPYGKRPSPPNIPDSLLDDIFVF